MAKKCATGNPRMEKKTLSRLKGIVDKLREAREVRLESERERTCSLWAGLCSFGSCVSGSVGLVGAQ